MSKHSIEKVNCPKCGKESEFMVWDSINTMLDPELKEKVRSRDGLSFKCPVCGAVADADYGFLYHQMEDQMMIYYVHGQEEADKVYEMFRGDSKISGIFEKGMKEYLYRIVLSRNEFREKLFIFDAGLDDRAIELLKVFYIAQVQKDNPELHMDEIRFQTSEGGEMELVYLNEGQPIGHSSVEREFYDIVMKEYIMKMPDIREDDIQIDFEWALRRVGELAE